MAALPPVIVASSSGEALGILACAAASVGSGGPSGPAPARYDPQDYSSSSSSDESSMYDSDEAPTPPPPAGLGKGKRALPAMNGAGYGKSLSVARPPPQKKTRSSGSGVASASASAVAGSGELDRDAALVSPLPVVAFIDAKFMPKACGHCSHCKAPPCATCKTCLLNAKLAPEKQKDKRRCEKLTCVRVIAKGAASASVAAATGAGAALAAGEGEEQDLEQITEDLVRVSNELATVSAQRGTPGFDEAAYRELIERKKRLHLAKIKAKAKKTKRKIPFPTGAHEAWGVVSSLEKLRQKFAKFVVKNSSSESCKRTVAIKREMRDELDGIIKQWCVRFGEVIAPVNEEEEFFTLLDKLRS